MGVQIKQLQKKISVYRYQETRLNFSSLHHTSYDNTIRNCWCLTYLCKNKRNELKYYFLIINNVYKKTIRFFKPKVQF